MVINKNIEFESNKINVIRLLNALKENKFLIEKNNAVILLSKKYLKHLSKNCSITVKKEGDKELILIGDKSVEGDYHYSIVLETCQIDKEKVYRITSINTTDPIYDGVFVQPKEQTDLTSICFTKKAEKILRKAK